MVSIGQMSSETEPETTASESEKADNEDERVIENTSSLVDLGGQSSTVRKSLLRDEMLINAQKFTSQVS